MTIVLCSDAELAIGDVRQGRVTDAEREWRDVAFRVVELATKADYDACVESHGVDPTSLDPKPYYYRVWMD